MSEESNDDRHLTIPLGFGKPMKNDDNMRQVIARLHKHDYALLRVMLKKDEMSFQKFVLLCARAYLDADPHIIKAIRSYRELEVIPQDIKDKHVLSHRERASIYDELEKDEKESKE